LFDGSYARLRGEVGLRPVAQDPDHGAHLLQSPRRGLLDGLEGGQCAVGVGCRQGTPGLGLDDDGRDVVADRVVELTRELVALTELGLLDVSDPGACVIADRRAERGREQENPNPPTTSVALVGSATCVTPSQTRMSPKPIAASRPAPQRNSA